MSKLGKILVAMSGGIDSTVTALLLHEQGYEVIGITMKTWDYSSSGVKSKKETGCCSLDSLQDARKVAVDMGFHHFILDIATGHYARVKSENNRYYISKAKDLNKDQSYVLWGLNQECLKRSKYPLAELTKPEVRQIAFDRGYDNLSKKAESYEICFVPENNYRDFLKHRLPTLENEVSQGFFINKNGEVIGQHSGYPFFTVGQC